MSIDKETPIVIDCNTTGVPKKAEKTDDNLLLYKLNVKTTKQHRRSNNSAVLFCPIETPQLKQRNKDFCMIKYV